jgi:hypothetical protein
MTEKEKIRAREGKSRFIAFANFLRRPPTGLSGKNMRKQGVL